jgi:hypothetical protein
MAIKLKHLSVHGPGLLPAVVPFNEYRTLIRGPSDTGKSHIWDCIWYLLGGTGILEQFPESEGYDSLELVFLHDQHEYLVRKAMAGGAARVLVRLDTIWVAEDVPNPLEDVAQDLGELLVKLSGAEGKKVLHTRSKKAAITGDDLRHWALLSQPGMISRDATKGKGHGSDKRVSSYSLFLSGLDDSAVELYKSSSLKDQAKGKLAAAELEFARLQSLIPAGADRPSAVAALARVDERLDMVATQLQARPSVLKELRQKIAALKARPSVPQRLSSPARQRCASASRCWTSSIQATLRRLGATDESIAFFQALEETRLVRSAVHRLSSMSIPVISKPKAPTKYRAMPLQPRSRRFANFGADFNRPLRMSKRASPQPHLMCTV